MNKQTLLLLATVSLLSLTVSAQVKPKTNQKSNTWTQKSDHPFFDALTYADTARPKMVSKEISYEVPAEKTATIQVNNNVCNIDIRPWAEAKVMIVTTVTLEEKQAATLKTNEELLEAGGISIKSFGNRIDIQSRDQLRFEPLSRELFGTYNEQNDHNLEARRRLAELDRKVYTTTPVPTTAETELRSQIMLETLKKGEYWSVTGRTTKTMVIFVPEGSKLDIDNKNTAILINANIGTASFKLSHSNLDARDFKKLTVIGDYYNINISDVEDAELELENGTFTAGIIKSLDLDSENSEIEYESGNYIYMRSQSDRITIDEISKVDGRKLYGELRIGKLLTSLDIEGTNADIKIRNILPIVEKIKVTDKYADLRFPVKNLTNYAVTFHGENSTVFAPFEKVAAPVDPAEKTPEKEKATSTKSTGNMGTQLLASVENEHNLTGFQTYNKLNGYNKMVGEKAPVKFTAAAGNTTGAHTRFEIVCHQCSVDFK
jgi:hypothetical protein